MFNIKRLVAHNQSFYVTSENLIRTHLTLNGDLSYAKSEREWPAQKETY